MLGEGGTSDHNDTVDIVFQSVQKTRETVDEDGKTQYIQVMDDTALWCKTLSVASNKLSQVIYEMMEFLRVGEAADKHMSKERAKVWRDTTLGIVESVKKSLDSKSSESIRNKDNSQGTLIDKINKNSVEKIYTMKDTAKKGIFDSILHKEVEDNS